MSVNNGYDVRVMRPWMFCLAFQAAPALAAPPVARELVYTSTRGYQLVLPGDRKPEAGILFLHGAQTPEARRRARDELFQPFFDRFSATHPVAVAYVDGRVGTCGWDRSLACWPMRAPWEETRFLADALAALRAETKVSRWIALGFSNGGYFLGSLIQGGERLPADAAVIAAGGQAWSGGPSFAWTPDLTILTGKADAENRPQGLELHADLERAGYGKLARLEHKEFDGGHELPEPLLSETLAELIAATDR